ncbi:phosphate transporter [Methanolacinia petrolearia DSM 11571]|uniref:Phosphate transporter n=1 Tax=Methanolacinia petrolearia (strain DSM 11571 / OCM 486 / SEBR 4847) TaxID=679926 RepID=E1RJ44_METP4|nr:inorganic phosphate transporter [Methanolacinia petrolearia]ADN36714.1 phosphate transporter [Methanolacinia petrolearia DSM 11571]
MVQEAKSTLIIIIIAVLMAFFFTFTNGFQDASAIAATFIASKSASPRKGIIFVAFFAFLGAMLGGTAVAFTISELFTTDSGITTVYVMAVGLLSATAWNLITWKFGLPSSSTHGLIGGLTGSAVAAAGIGSVYWGFSELILPPHELTGFTKIIFFLVISVIIGFVGSYLLQKTASFMLRNSKRTVNKSIIRLNWIAVALMSFSNGSNDSQKELGIIALVLFSAGEMAVLDVPLWARIICAVLLGLGTLSGGWRIMKTLGDRIFKLHPLHSFDSQLSSGISVALSTSLGAPVSSTHIISTSIIGVGAAENPKKVKWSTGRDIVTAMIMTIPVTMVISGTIYYFISYLTGI